ncbi:unnamed protein product [Scytosiphon promiscuus]
MYFWAWHRQNSAAVDICRRDDGDGVPFMRLAAYGVCMRGCCLLYVGVLPRDRVSRGWGFFLFFFFSSSGSCTH